MTNIPEMMTLGCTQNPLYGATRNPWDLSRGVHSSTGGGAAAIAAGYVPSILQMVVVHLDASFSDRNLWL
ncbi:amidase family protein [Vibrio lentus]|nr:amidase family protein [Vibrio lentus]